MSHLPKELPPHPVTPSSLIISRCPTLLLRRDNSKVTPSVYCGSDSRYTIMRRSGHNIEGTGTVVLADSLIMSRYRIPGTPYVPPTTRRGVPRPLYHTWHHNPLIATCMIGWGMACDRGDGGFHRNVQPNASRYPSA